jgi:hypothetical protein
MAEDVTRIVPVQLPDGSIGESILTVRPDGSAAWTILPWPGEDDCG